VKIDELMADFEAGIADAESDYPDAPISDIIREVAMSLAEFADSRTKAEFLRRVGLRL
jgi:hypothetical protein